MNENEWTKSICDRLRDNFNDGIIFVDTLCKIPYLQEIVCYDNEWNTKDHKQDVYIDVIRLFKDGVITDDDLAEFSDDFKDTVNELNKRFM